MKKLIYVCLLLIGFSINSYAQKETSWWHFGYYSGLNFNILNDATADDATTVTDMPKPIIGPLNTREGCFTVSTYDGQLLFSSDGSTVYDKNGNIMINGTGLLGDYSATQSGIVVPKPGSTTEYYVVTVPAMGGTDGLNYSIIDISLNGGLGEVTSKNNPILAGSVNENIAAVPNTNGKDYWLIHRTLQTFYVWAITSAGISTTPNFSITNTLINIGSGSSINPQGEMIVSSDFTKIASLNWGGKQVASAIFNPTTGQISDIRVLNCSFSTYGGTFSPNNQYLYVGTGFFNYGQLYVNTWDNIRAGNAMTYLDQGFSNVKTALDNRLYGIQLNNTPTETPTKNLAIVLNPDTGGTDIKHFTDYLLNDAAFGLPSFAAGFIRIIPKEQPFACTAHNRTYTVEVDLSGGNAPARLEWYFGDGTARVNQSVTTSKSEYSLKHSYNNSGLYTITVTPYKADGTSLTPITMEANIVDCSLKANRMTRSDLLNSKQLSE
ncbi:PKD domain-containing protein [Dysgonomonas macrotermitis]|uniref:PKD domain-containing protein n=1 Tax=Dysgonomonas macrotermitis TaxID=1346286 RepID=A0A1M4ZTZ7_9BACT|nr:PKD domain-containing protein [Dysgonomonas macrotermitis]SHF21086.1 PKD domain-containing protein [Dysgonomonas macrotermitis]